MILLYEVLIIKKNYLSFLGHYPIGLKKQLFQFKHLFFNDLTKLLNEIKYIQIYSLLNNKKHFIILIIIERLQYHLAILEQHYAVPHIV